MALMHPYSGFAKVNQAHLQIMETTVLHKHIYSSDYYADKPVYNVGLARTASIIKSNKDEATNSMLVDNGDSIARVLIIGNYVYYERDTSAGQIYPAIALMHTIGFDATTLRNHKFNYGLECLDAALSGKNFPVVNAVVNANVANGKKAGNATKDKSLPHVQPYVHQVKEFAR